MAMLMFFDYSKVVPASERTPIRAATHAVNPAQAITDKPTPAAKVLYPIPLHIVVDVDVAGDIPLSPSQGMLPRDPLRTKVDPSPEKSTDVEGSPSAPLVCKKRLISKRHSPLIKRPRTAGDGTSFSAPLETPGVLIVGRQRPSTPPTHSIKGKSSRSREPEESKFNKNLNTLPMSQKYFSKFSP